MKKYMVLFTCLMLAVAAQAKILVIADIDDTLKVSNILNRKRALISAFDDDSHFAGMSKVFRGLEKAHDDIEFHYVSLAPRVLMGDRHEDFLKDNDFPVTALHMNSGLTQDPELKQKVIRQLLAEKQPQFVIYFGDNGQFDTMVYEQMTQEFPRIPSVTYIREAYSHFADSKFPTRPGQIGFVTSVEVTLDLISRELVSRSLYNEVEKIVYDRLKKDWRNEAFGPMVFPGWQDCRDFQWIWKVDNPSENLLKIEAAIAKRCQ